MQTVVLEKWLKHSERNAVVTTVVLHATGGATADSSISWLKNPWAMVKGILTKFPDASYHYIIERDGTVFKCVPLSKKAWHAGISNGPDGRNVNAYSVGIAFANKNDGEDPYTFEQTLSAQVLIDQLWEQFPKLAYITTHRLITSRKSDPKGFGFYGFAKKHTRLKPWMDASLNRTWD